MSSLSRYLVNALESIPTPYFSSPSLTPLLLNRYRQIVYSLSFSNILCRLYFLPDPSLRIIIPCFSIFWSYYKFFRSIDWLFLLTHFLFCCFEARASKTLNLYIFLVQNFLLSSELLFSLLELLDWDSEWVDSLLYLLLFINNIYFSHFFNDNGLESIFIWQLLVECLLLMHFFETWKVF